METTWSLWFYLYCTIGDLLQDRKIGKPQPDNSYFIKTLNSMIDRALLDNEDEFRRKLDSLEDYISNCGEIAISTLTNIYIVHEIDDEGYVINRYIEQSQLINASIYREGVIPAINVDIRTRSLQMPEPKVGTFDKLFPNSDTALQSLLSGKTLITLPLKAINAKDFRIYRPESEELRTLRIRSQGIREETIMQRLIIYNGLFGFPKLTAKQTLALFNEDDERELRVMSYRLKHSNRYGPNLSIFP